MFLKINTPINLRSSYGVFPTNDLGTPSLLTGDIVEASDPHESGNYRWRRLIRIWRAGIEISLPVSPTGEVWFAESMITVTTNWVTPTVSPETPEFFIAYYPDGRQVKYVPAS